MTILTEILGIVGVGSVAGIVLMILSKFIPNNKLYAFGYKLGDSANTFGTARMGTVVWEKIEDFLINSVGVMLSGFKDGLDPTVTNTKVVNKKEKFKNVRK